MCPDASRNARTRCEFPGCTQNVWQDPDGSYSSYCGKTHRDAMSQIRGATLCQKCNAKPVYVENGRRHPFCGKRCADAYRNGTENPGSPRASPATTPGGGQCKLAGCQRAVFIASDGVPGLFCSQQHRKDAVTRGSAEACLFCNEMPKMVIAGKQSDFCSRQCGQDTVLAAPIILYIDKKHVSFTNVKKQFEDQWKHPTAIPKVLHIWKIYGKGADYDKFARYKLNIERTSGIKDGNTRRRWHGTIRACRLGDDENLRDLCGISSCSLCQIIRSSFQLTRAGQRTNFGRFGQGIYASATSSKANDYIAERGGSNYKAMLLNEVIMGKTTKLTTGDTTLVKPPAGFDSVIGEPGGDLNYDETIVYTNDAIRPLFLVIFKP